MALFFLSRSLGATTMWGVTMNPAPAFGILYAVFTLVLAGLAVYALVLAIIFLRLRIAELKQAAPPKSSPLG